MVMEFNTKLKFICIIADPRYRIRPWTSIPVIKQDCDCMVSETNK